VIVWDKLHGAGVFGGGALPEEGTHEEVVPADG
jgi:hypothetical protein